MFRLPVHLIIVLPLFGLLFAIPSSAVEAQSPAPRIRYVAPVAAGAGDCSSWEHACALSTALQTAQPNDELWLRAGVYVPHATDPSVFFNLTGKGPLAIYGGFAGNETVRDQRAIELNRVIFSGDLAGDDRNEDGDFIANTIADIQGVNSYVLIGACWLRGPVVIDGVTFTAVSARSESSSFSYPKFPCKRAYGHIQENEGAVLFLFEPGFERGVVKQPVALVRAQFVGINNRKSVLYTAGVSELAISDVHISDSSGAVGMHGDVVSVQNLTITRMEGYPEWQFYVAAMSGNDIRAQDVTITNTRGYRSGTFLMTGYRNASAERVRIDQLAMAPRSGFLVPFIAHAFHFQASEGIVRDITIQRVTIDQPLHSLAWFEADRLTAERITMMQATSDAGAFAFIGERVAVDGFTLRDVDTFIVGTIWATTSDHTGSLQLSNVQIEPNAPHRLEEFNASQFSISADAFVAQGVRLKGLRKFDIRSRSLALTDAVFDEIQDVQMLAEQATLRDVLARGLQYPLAIFSIDTRIERMHITGSKVVYMASGVLRPAGSLMVIGCATTEIDRCSLVTEGRPTSRLVANDVRLEGNSIEYRSHRLPFTAAGALIDVDEVTLANWSVVNNRAFVSHNANDKTICPGSFWDAERMMCDLTYRITPESFSQRMLSFLFTSPEGPLVYIPQSGSAIVFVRGEDDPPLQATIAHATVWNNMVVRRWSLGVDGHLFGETVDSTLPIGLVRRPYRAMPIDPQRWTAPAQPPLWMSWMLSPGQYGSTPQDLQWLVDHFDVRIEHSILWGRTPSPYRQMTQPTLPPGVTVAASLVQSCRPTANGGWDREAWIHEVLPLDFMDNFAGSDPSFRDEVLDDLYFPLVAYWRDTPWDPCGVNAGGNLDGISIRDPLLRNPAAGDIAPRPGSPVIDAGSSALSTVDSTLIARDLFGNPRSLDGNGDGVARSDLGAVEVEYDGSDGASDESGQAPIQSHALYVPLVVRR